MGKGVKKYAPPIIWPGVSELEELLEVENNPFTDLIEEGGILLGLYFGLDEITVKQISNLLKNKIGLRIKLIIGLFPACTCGQNELKGLLSLQSSFKERAEFRIYTINNTRGGMNSSLLYIDETNENFILSTGPLSGWNSLNLHASRTSFVFRPETTMVKDWINWFDYIWIRDAIPLNSSTIRVPELVPAEASPKAIQLWNDYLDSCEENKDEEIQFEVDPETGVLIAINEDGGKINTPSTDLELPPISPLIERISRLYSAGKLVSFNKLTKIPPVDSPARAEWFGMKSFQEVGHVKLKMEYRISAIDPEDLKKFENLKKGSSRLLRTLGFSLNDGLHWIPAKMIDLLEEELNRIKEEALYVIKGAMDGSRYGGESTEKNQIDIINDFISRRKDRIIADANKIYQEFFPGKVLSAEAIEKISFDLKKRLENVFSGNVIPEITKNSISFDPESIDQAYILLKELATFPRMILSEDFYFLRGIRIDENSLLQAVNVCNDQIIEAAKNEYVKNRADLERDFIKEIDAAEVNSEMKCRAIFALMDGKPIDEIRENYLD